MVHRRNVSATDRRARSLQPEVRRRRGSTTATVIAATLGIRDISHLTAAQVVRSDACTCCWPSTMPCNRACSPCRAGTWWALTLPAPQCARGWPTAIPAGSTAAPMICWARARKATRSAAGLPRAVALYGSLPQQLEDPASFASQLGAPAQGARRAQLYAAQLDGRAEVKSPGLLVLVHELPDRGGLEVTAINFGNQAADEAVAIAGASAWRKGGRCSRAACAAARSRRGRQPAAASRALRREGLRIGA